jgi:hypothetical protein
MGRERWLEVKTSEILIEAKRLISDPGNWLKMSFSNADDPTSPRATKFCAAGSIHRAAGQPMIIGAHTRGGPFEFFRQAIGQKHIGDWNDEHTHEEVMSAFDRAIELAKKKEEANVDG